MSSTAIVWTALAALYLGFFGWYTSCAGPLDDDEIERYSAMLTERGIDPESLAVWRAFMESDTGDDFAMFNAIDVLAKPRMVEGVDPNETSEQVLARYSEPFFDEAMGDAAHPIFMGTAAAPAVDVWGIEGANEWTNGAIVRYRSRRDVLDQVVYTAGTDIHKYKIAGLEKTIAYPLDPFFHMGDPRLIVGLVLLPIGLGWQLRCTRADLRAARRASGG